MTTVTQISPPAGDYMQNNFTNNDTLNSDDDWTQLTDPSARRRIQNRIAQRNYRKKNMKQRLDSLERQGREEAISSSNTVSNQPQQQKTPSRSPERSFQPQTTQNMSQFRDSFPAFLSNELWSSSLTNAPFGQFYPRTDALVPQNTGSYLSPYGAAPEQQSNNEMMAPDFAARMVSFNNNMVHVQPTCTDSTVFDTPAMSSSLTDSSKSKTPPGTALTYMETMSNQSSNSSNKSSNSSTSCVRYKDTSKMTALHSAALSGHTGVVELLLSKGADVKVANANGKTALHLTAANGHTDVARVLLEKGAEINSCDKDGKTALHRAAEQGHEQVASLLIERGIDVDIKDHAGQTALQRAAETGQDAVLRRLLDKGVDFDTKDNNGMTSLHLAATNDYEVVVWLLLGKGADIDAKDHHGQTALHRAAERGRESVVRLLIDTGSDINAETTADPDDDMDVMEI